MKTVLYHWWGDEGEHPHYSNLRTPLLLSIATLRAVNPSIRIEVLDMSFRDPQEHGDWIHFQRKLDFHISHIKPYFARRTDIPGWKHLSRLFDIKRHHWPDTVIYCDSDVFWFRDPLPLEQSPDRFCFDGFNSGMFYFDPESQHVSDFFELFEAYTISAVNSIEVRHLMKKYIGYDAWYGVWDEMILTFMFNEHRSFFNQIGNTEHATARALRWTDLSQMKMLHCNGLMVANPLAKRSSERRHSRGLACLIFKELYENISTVLNEGDLKLIFTEEELDFYIPRQFSLVGNVNRVMETMSADGHFHLDKCV